MYATLLAIFCSSATAYYDENIAYKGVMFSAAAYCSYKDLDKWDCGEPCTSTNGIIKGSVVHSIQNDDDLFGFVAYNQKEQEIVVSFRGTNGLDFKNWYMNMKTDKVPYDDVTGALVHVGWYTGWQKMKE
jgi:hypothetical protein